MHTNTKLLSLFITFSSVSVDAQNNPPLNDGPNNRPQPESNVISPARRIARTPRPLQNQPPINDRYHSIDGSGNNRFISEMGAAHTQLVRLVDNDYADNIDALAGAERSNPRAISNAVNQQEDDMPNNRGASDFLWQWGQFLDHDIDLTDGVDPAEPIDITIPTGDEYFDPQNTGEVVIAMTVLSMIQKLVKIQITPENKLMKSLLGLMHPMFMVQIPKAPMNNEH